MSDDRKDQPAEGTPKVSPGRAAASTVEIVNAPQITTVFPPLRALQQFIANSTLFYQGIGWRGYNEYIGARLFEPDLTNRIKRRVVNSERITKATRDLAGSQRYAGKSARQLKAEAQKMIDGLAGDLSDKKASRFIVYVINNVFIRLYHQGIHVNEDQFALVKQAAVDAEKRKISMIFLPCHKSHIDYLVLGYLFFRTGLSAPFVAAGDNLNMPLVGPLLQQCGAFFHRRSFADDPLYTAVFKEYIETLLVGGYNVEAFIEGTRSRTGKLLNPKLGVMKIIIEAFLNGRVNDLYICPISIGYDKVLETEAYVNELLGAEKQQESLSQLLNSTRILALKLGRIDVRFAKPFSIKEYTAQQLSTRPNFDPRKNPADFTVFLKSLAYSVLSDINAVSLVMPSGLIGTLLLTLRGRGVGRSELICKVDWLRQEILDRGGHVADFVEETGVIVDKTVKVMHGLVGVRNELLEPVIYVIKRFELSYYRNELIHLFLNDSVVCCAVYAAVKNGGLVSADRVVSKSLVLQLTQFLSQVLKFEFIFPPGRVEDNLDASLQRLTSKDILRVDADTISISANELRTGRENFDFYCFLIWPFIETYWLAVISLFALPDPGLVIERLFQDRVQRFALTMYYEGDLSYFESINKETLKNAYQVLQEMGAIERKRVDKFVVVSLPEKFAANQRHALRELVENMGRFRREGKNRRDNANASDRSLRLAKLMSGDSKL